MKQALIHFFLLGAFCCGSGCDDVLIGEVEPNTIMNNFDVFGQDFQDKYGLFEVRGVNWELLLETHRTPLAANPTEENLYLALTGLIDDLQDSHVSLSHPTGQFSSYDGGIYGKLKREGYLDADFEIVRENYLTLIEGLYETIYYGTVHDDIGYIYLPEIKDEPEFYESYLPKVLTDLKETRGLIIDIRNNEGGEDEGGRTLAGFFTDEKKLYMVSRYKTGPDPDDFGDPHYWYVEPAKKDPYTKPIVLLTNRYSISAAETFSLAMKSFPHVYQMGDTTTGAFSDAVSRQLPNGWGYVISVGDYRDAENISYEGVGLAPDSVMRNTPVDLEGGRDRVLEAAIEKLL